MDLSAYQKKIIAYYKANHNAYKDVWYLDKAKSIHYGYHKYWFTSLPKALQKMNEVLMQKLSIKDGEIILDAGCGIGGSAFYIANKNKVHVDAISIIQEHIDIANDIVKNEELKGTVAFHNMDYSKTSFADNKFDAIWALESSCYAVDKLEFALEQYRICKANGKIAIADGMVSEMEKNHNIDMRTWLDGWAVNNLETPDTWVEKLSQAGFHSIEISNISKYILPSSFRLYMLYYAAMLYYYWHRLKGGKTWTQLQFNNIKANYYQYHCLRKKMWGYYIITAKK